MFPQNFTNKSQEAIQNAAKIAAENGQPQVDPPHLFVALLAQEDGVVVSVLKKLNANLKEIRDTAQGLINALPKQTGPLSGGGMGQIMLGQEKRELTHTEILNRDYYRGRFASLVWRQNWEE